ERIPDVVGGQRHRNAGLQQAADGRQAATDVEVVAPAHEVEIGQRKADHTDASGGELRDQRSLLGAGQRRQLGQVAGRDTALPAGANRLAHDLAHVQVLGLVAEIDVEVGVDPELGGQCEDDLDVAARVGVVVRAAADEVGAHLEGAAEQGLGRRRLEDALLGEGAELEVDGGRVLALEREHRPHAHEADDGVDLDVRAHRGRAGGDGQVEHAPGAAGDVGGGEGAL